MKSNRKNGNRIGTQLVSSVFVFQQIAAASPAFAHDFAGHSAFGSNSAGPSTWQPTQSPTAALAGFAQSHSLPASFGLGVSNLPTAQQTVPLPQTHVDFNGVHRNSAHMAALQSGQRAPQQNAFAQQMAASMPSHAVQLDLTSTASTIVLSQASVMNGSSVTVQVGAGSATFNVGDKVTPAELVAIQQAQTRHGQSIEIDQQGRATGGTFSLGSVTSAAGVAVASVVVPNNVTALDRAITNSNISMPGDLVNYGSILQLGSKYAPGTSTISAMDIINQSGASIVGRNRGDHALDLSLNASHDFTNLGTISSGGALSISAGGTLTNSGATISAAKDINLQSTVINNSGVIASKGGNINLGTGDAQVMNVNNAGGTLSAVNGDINVRDPYYTGAGNSTVSGGDLLSKNLNLYAGAGTANVDVKELTGTVNSAGNAIHVSASTSALKIGDMNLTGDPTFINDSGDFVFTGGAQNYGDDLTVIASKNIISTSDVTSITAVDAFGQGKNITLVAGANVTTDGTTASFDGPSLTGGSVDLSGADPNLVISTASTKGVQYGGNIVVAAFTGSDPTSGRVVMPDASKLDAAGFGGGSGGNISIFGGNATTAVSVGNIANSSYVTLVGNQAVLKDAGPITYSMATGAKTNSNDIVRNYSNNTFGEVAVMGNITGTSNVSIAAAKANLIGSIDASNNITITATKNVDINSSLTAGPGGINIIASGDIASVGSNSINIKTESAANGGNITMAAGVAFSTASTGITTLTGYTAAGGHIDLQGNAIKSLSSKGTSASANGGNITLFAVDSSISPGAQGYIYVPGALVITSGGGSSGKSGNIYVQAGLNSSGDAIGTPTNTISADTSGGLVGTGNITLVAASPFFSPTTPITVNSSTSALDGFLISSFNQGAINYTFIKTNNANLEILKGGNYTLKTGGIANTNIGVLVDGDLTAGGINIQNSLTLAAIGNVFLNGGITASGGFMAVSESNVQATVPGLHITTKSTTGDAGDVTLIAGADLSFVLTGHVRILGSSDNGGSVLGDITSIDATSTALGGKGGNVTMLAFAGPGGGNGVIQLSALGLIGTSSLTGTSGDFTAMGGHGTGSTITIGTVSAGSLLSGQSGNIFLQTAQPVATATNFLDYNFGGKNLGPSPLQLLTGTFTAGDIAASGLITKSGGVQIANNGNLTIGLIDVGGVAGLDSGSGGGVIVQNGSKSSALYIGDIVGSNYIGQIVAAGDDSAASDGGFVWVKQTGDKGISLKDADSVTFAATGTGADFGGTIILDAGKGVLNLGGAYSFRSGAGVGSGGTIAFTGSDVVTTSGQTIEMESDAFGGVASVNISGTNSHKLDFTANAFNMSANDVSFISPNAPLNIRDGFINTTTGGGFGGGKIQVEAKGIYAIGASPVQFVAPANINGDGGEIIFKNLSIDPIFIGAKTGDFQFDARGGSTSGNGGKITITSAGNLTVDNTTAFNTIVFNPRSTTGDGGHLTLEAGKNLLILGNLNADSGSPGAGNGGSITLKSNSTTAFTITATKPVNGITGTLSAKGVTGGALSITNTGGAIANSLAMINTFGTLTESATSITAKGQLGGSLASKISLETTKSTGMNFSVPIQATEVALISEGGITASKITAGTLTYGSQKAVTITNVSTDTLKIGSSYAGGTTTIKSAGSIETLAKNIILGTSINITSTANDSKYGIVSNGVIGGSGAVAIVAPGDIFINGDITGETGVKITNLHYLTEIRVNANISAGAKGSTVITSNLGSIIAATSNSIDAGTAVTLNAPKGLVTVGNVGNVRVPNTVGITSLYSTTLNGNVNFLSSLNVKVTQTIFAGLGDIYLNGNIASTKDLSTINLVTSSFGAVTDINAVGHKTIQAGGINIVGPRGASFSNSDVIATKSNLTVTVANGYLLVDTPSYFSSNFGTTNLTASVDVTVRGNVNGCLGTILKATKTDPGMGSIQITDNAQVTALGPTGVLTITASGGNGITIGKNAFVNATKDATITAPTGSLTAAAGSKVNAVNGKLTISAKNNITENGTLKGGTLVSLTTTAASTTNTLTVGSISTANGNIIVKGAGKSITVSDGAVIEAHGVKTTPKATILIQATNVSKGNVSTITIGGAIKTSGLGGSDVSILIGASAKKNPTNTLTGFNIDTTKGGSVYSGTTPTALIGSIGTPISLTTEGANIIFNTPAQVNCIVFRPGSSVLADPPVSLSNARVNLVTLPSASLGFGDTNAVNNTGARTPINQLSLVNTTPTVYTLDNAQLGALATLQTATASSDSYVLQNWISETELGGGAIPATFVTESTGEHHMTKGSMLLAPKVDTTVRTAFGDVKIKAKSLVLVMALSHGLAVYNLHDKAKDSVVLTAGGQSISLSPGRHAVVTAAARGGFESSNPAQLVSYGPLTEVMLSKELKVFHSEFSLPSMIGAVPALRNIVVSGQPESRALAKEFLKTTSIILQLKPVTNTYRQFRKPALTAYNR